MGGELHGKIKYSNKGESNKGENWSFLYYLRYVVNVNKAIYGHEKNNSIFVLVV